jgi:predicted AAA+ superfamily ATPase
MFARSLAPHVDELLKDFAAVAIVGARQVGKTTLAHQLAEQRPSVYLDLESPTDRARLSEPEAYLRNHEDELVVLDEVQRMPQLFAVLRGQIDRNRRRGKRSGQFLLLGSASRELLQQTGESLAGRIDYVELSPLHLLEVGDKQLDPLWLRGGFPESLLARNDAASNRWRNAFISTYLERDLPQLGPRIAAETLRRFWTMLAHRQSAPWNAEELARSLALSGKTVASYLDLFVDLFLVRRLPPWHQNVSKRLVKTPRVYVRDSGILHSLLGLRTQDEILGHPIVGKSWEGFVIDALLAVIPDGTTAHFYRTSAGAEIDLLLHLPGNRLWAIEIKRGLAPKVEKGFHLACEDVRPSRRLVVYPGTEQFPLPSEVEAIPLGAAMSELTALS